MTSKETEKILVWVELDKEIYEDLKKILPDKKVMEVVLTKLAQSAFEEKLQKSGKDKLIKIIRQVSEVINQISE